MRNRAPPFAPLFDRDRPPLTSTAHLAMASPRSAAAAIPRARLRRCERTDRRCGRRCSAAMPGPSSATVTMALSPSVARTRISIGRRRRAVFDRVVDHVGDRLPQHQTIDGDDDGFGRVQVRSLAALLRKNTERRRRHRVVEVSKIEALARQTDRAGIAVGQAQAACRRGWSGGRPLRACCRWLLCIPPACGFRRGRLRRCRESPPAASGARATRRP